MHVHFLGEADDGITVSSQHALVLRNAAIRVTFESGSQDRAKDVNEADIIHLVTGEQTDHALLRRLLAARKSGQPIVRWWTPQDILWAMHHLPSRRFAQFLDKLEVLQVSNSANITDALTRIGISSRRMPMVSPHLHSTIEPAALPSTFTVLTYLPTARREFHGGHLVDALIREMPDARFLILGDEQTDYSEFTNVESLGHVEDISRAIRRATVNVQLRLDGEPSRLAYETLCHGRHVVSSANIPNSHHADSVDGCLKILRRLRGSAEFNLEGREFVCREHECVSSSAAFRQMLEESISGGRVSMAVTGTLQAAKLLALNPGVLSRKPFPRLDVDSLPSNAVAMRALLSNHTAGVSQRG